MVKCWSHSNIPLSPWLKDAAEDTHGERTDSSAVGELKERGCGDMMSLALNLDSSVSHNFLQRCVSMMTLQTLVQG